MSEINTIREEDSLPSGPYDTVPTSFVQSHASLGNLGTQKCELEQVFGEFEKYLAAKTKGMTQGNLEKALIILLRDLSKFPRPDKLSLRPLVAMHPLVAVANSDSHKDSIVLVEREMRRIITRQPAVAQRYMWIMQAAEFLNNLAVFWRLVTAEGFQHRAHLRGTVVISTQLAECQRLTSLCFLPEVLYVAAKPDSLLLSESEKTVCGNVSQAFTRCLELLVLMSRTMPPSSRSQQPHNSRISPSVLTSVQILVALHPHPLTLPRWWRCKCLQTPEEQLNVNLKTELTALCQQYLDLERSLASRKTEA